MFNNPNIFNPSITYNNRVYFSTPSGGKYEHKIYNPNDQSTRLPYNMGQRYNQGTPKYYENLKGANSSIFKHDNIIGKTVYSESGRPILIKGNSITTIPQVKFDYDVPVRRDWIQTEYCDVDDEYVNKSVREHMKQHFNLPLDSDLKPTYRATNPTQLPVITNETINDMCGREYDLKPVEMTNENIMKLIKNNTNTNIQTPKPNPIKPQQNINLIQGGTKTETFKPNIREPFSCATLNDTDDLYKQMIRSYATAVSFYLNNNQKYKAWSENWKILDDNLRKTDLSVKRLKESDNEIAYTENKGEVIKFRWRDKKDYVSKNVFMYVVLHELTHQVFPPNITGHGGDFPNMLCIMCVAGIELDLFDLSAIPRDVVYTNNQEICSRNSIYRELMNGIELLRAKNKGSNLYYDHLTEYINKKMEG